MLTQLGITDVMTAIDNLKPDTPVLDSSYLNKNKVVELLEAAAHRMIDDRCKDVSTFVLCSFEGVTYFIDEEARLWDINADGRLSILSVGIVGVGVDGFAADVAKRLIEQGDLETLNDIEGMLEDDYMTTLKGENDDDEGEYDTDQ